MFSASQMNSDTRKKPSSSGMRRGNGAAGAAAGNVEADFAQSGVEERPILRVANGLDRRPEHPYAVAGEHASVV